MQHAFFLAAAADGDTTGYPMARNLRSKIAESDTLFIHDIDPAMSERFEQEVGNVKVVKSVREVAENSVRFSAHGISFFLYTPPYLT